MNMKNIDKKIFSSKILKSSKSATKVLLIVSLFSFYRVAFADKTDDLLSGTTTQALATINNGGRYWAYIIDGAISLAAFAKTKNPFVFASVLGVALGITVIYKMAGGT